MHLVSHRRDAARASCLRCSGVSMPERTPPESGEIHFSEIKLDPQEAQDIFDRFWKATSVLTARLWSKHPRLRPRPRAITDIQISMQTNWRDIGQALRARFLERAFDACDCYSCRSQYTKRGQRERCWVHAVVFAQMGDPSDLVELLKNSRTFTQFDRNILAELLDAVFKCEIDDAWTPVGRPRNIAAQSCTEVAMKFYTDWKSINRQCQIKDWSHSDEMKDEACRVAIEYHRLRQSRGTVRVSNHPMDKTPEFEQVRELMDRPRSRRR